MTEQIVEQAQETQEVQAVPNPFSESSWSEQPIPLKSEEVKQEVATTETATTETVAETVKPEVKEDVLEADEWLKKEFGWEIPRQLKREIEELRQLKQSGTKEEKEFANEVSKKIYENLKEGKEDDVYSFLSTKKKLAKVPDMKAVDVLRLQIELTNKDYSEQDVSDIIEERYVIPEKPEQALSEGDEEYDARVAKWQVGVEKVQRRIERDAIAAKQELAKINSELVLPDIQPAKVATTDNQPDQKELERLEQIRSNYVSKLESDFKLFTGFEAKYKDEEVEIPVSFGMSEEDKFSLKNELVDFNVDDFILNRWFKNGQPDVTQIMSDVTLLRKKEDIMQKMVNEVGSKMKERYIKMKANITVDGSQRNATTIADKPVDNLQEQIAFLWQQK